MEAKIKNSKNRQKVWGDCLDALLELESGLTKGEMEFIGKMFLARQAGEKISWNAKGIIVDIYDRRCS